MIINNEEFSNIFNRRIFEDSKVELLSKIADYPDRYVGIFRPTKAKIKIIQNITQSHEIRFGDAMEEIIEKYFERQGYTLLDKRIVCENCEYNIDQLVQKGNKIYFIEQKVRDDHDSTKKRGQIENFEKKLNEIIKRYSEYEIYAYFYFIDPSLVKNRNYYITELENIEKEYGVKCMLHYGSSLFEEIGELPVWQETIHNLTEWRKNLPDFPEINFDIEAQTSFNETKKLSPACWRKLLNNDKIINEVFEVIFPTGETLKMLSEHFKTVYNNNNKLKIYNVLYKKLDTILKKKRVKK